MPRNRTVELTPAEARATARALHYWLFSSSDGEARRVFGSASGVRAAERTYEKLTADTCCADYERDGATHTFNCRKALAG